MTHWVCVFCRNRLDDVEIRPTAQGSKRVVVLRQQPVCTCRPNGSTMRRVTAGDRDAEAHQA